MKLTYSYISTMPQDLDPRRGGPSIRITSSAEGDDVKQVLKHLSANSRITDAAGKVVSTISDFTFDIIPSTQEETAELLAERAQLSIDKFALQQQLANAQHRVKQLEETNSKNQIEQRSKKMMVEKSSWYNHSKG